MTTSREQVIEILKSMKVPALVDAYYSSLVEYPTLTKYIIKELDTREDFFNSPIINPSPAQPLPRPKLTPFLEEIKDSETESLSGGVDMFEYRAALSDSDHFRSKYKGLRREFINLAMLFLGLGALSGAAAVWFAYWITGVAK